MKPRTLVIFAYHFPPDPAIGSARPFRFFKYLSRLGVECRVFTAAPGAASTCAEAEEIPDPFYAEPKNWKRWIQLGVRKFLAPGAEGLDWSLRACGAAQSFLRRRDDPSSRVTVLSTFPPLGAHLAAWQLTRREGVPWIADYRDPLGGLPIAYLNSFQTALQDWIEQRFMRAARLVIANTDTAEQLLWTRFPTYRKKFHTIWNGFDSEQRILPRPRPPRAYRLISHVGELYTGRTVRPILESLDRLIQAGRLSTGAVHISLAGRADPAALAAKDLVERAQAEGWLDLRIQAVPRSEAREIATTSDALLLIQPQSTVQVPGKLFEYLQIGRPILALLAPDSPSERILRKSGVPYRCIYPAQEPAAVDGVIEDFLQIPSDDYQPAPWFNEQFNARHQAEELLGLMERLG